jgi:hypothetical protein
MGVRFIFVTMRYVLCKVGEKPRKLMRDAEGVSSFLRGRLLTFDPQSTLKALPPPSEGYSYL